MSQTTRLLSAIGKGDPRAAEDLLPLVYQELRRLARANMDRRRRVTSPIFPHTRRPEGTGETD